MNKRNFLESDKPDIEKRVMGIVSDKLGVDLHEVMPDSRPKDDLGADSLDEVELIMEFEKEFDFEITDDDACEVKVVSDYFKIIAPELYGYIDKPERGTGFRV